MSKDSIYLESQLSAEMIKAIEFLRGIGLKVSLKEGASGFIPGVEIKTGELFVDPSCRISGLLHEAGHLACVPQQFRAYMSDDLESGMLKMLDDLQKMNLDPDDPLERAALQCRDPEATAWAWAAGLEIGFPPDEIIQDDEYDSDGASIRMMLTFNQYIGINGLAHVGMCKRGVWVAPEVRYPKMTAWLQN